MLFHFVPNMDLLKIFNESSKKDGENNGERKKAVKVLRKQKKREIIQRFTQNKILGELA